MWWDEGKAEGNGEFGVSKKMVGLGKGRGGGRSRESNFSFQNSKYVLGQVNFLSSAQ